MKYISLNLAQKKTELKIACHQPYDTACSECQNFGFMKTGVSHLVF